MGTYMDHVEASEKKKGAEGKIDDLFDKIRASAKKNDIQAVDSLLGELRTEITNLVRASVDESVFENRLKEETVEILGPAD